MVEPLNLHRKIIRPYCAAGAGMRMVQNKNPPHTKRLGLHEVNVRIASAQQWNTGLAKSDIIRLRRLGFYTPLQLWFSNSQLIWQSLQQLMTMADVQYLSDREIEEFLNDLDRNQNGFIEYSEVEGKLDEVHKEIAPEAKPHHLHHESMKDDARHVFLRSMIGSDENQIPRREFANTVRSWRIPSLEQNKKEEQDERDYLKSLSVWRRFRSYWAVQGPEIMFLALVVSMHLALGIWQMVKYLTQTRYRRAFGWGVVLAKTCAGALYPAFFFLILSMSRYFSTLLRRNYYISRFINWDLSQSFHIKMSIVALTLATLHAIGHLTGSFVYGSRPARQDNVAVVLGPDAVPRSYRDNIGSLPGWSGLTAFIMFWILALLSMPAVRRWSYEAFQLGHLLMFPIIGLLMAHGTAGLLQWPMFGYWLAFPTLLVLVERSVRIVVGFYRIPAELKILDDETVQITATVPKERIWRYQAGQYILLQIPEISIFQWHPFTISVCIGRELQVHIKTDGDWTGRLRKLVNGTSPQRIEIGINGPFGAPAQRFYDFNQSIIVGAGIGVTPFSGILTDLQERDHREGRTGSASRSWADQSESEKCEGRYSKDASRTDRRMADYRRVDFHWMVRDRNYLLWFSDLLNTVSRSQASHQQDPNPHLNIRIHTYVTQKGKNISTHIYRWLLEMHRTEEHPESPLTGLINPTRFGRPDLVHIMDDHYEDMRRLLASRKSENGAQRLRVGVFFCGAPVIGEILADRCRLLTARGMEDGNRIEYFFLMEVFG